MDSIKFMILLQLSVLGLALGRSVGAEKLQVVLKDTNDARDDDTCQDCLHIVDILKHLMSDEQFQTKLKGALEKVCDSLPDAFHEMCYEQVERNLPLAITFLTSIMNPDDVCAYLNLCTSELRREMQDLLTEHMQKTLSMDTVRLDSSILCSVCTYVINVLECLLPKDKTESVVSDLLGQICNLLPSVIRGQCTGLINKYVKMLIDMLLNVASPNSICSVLRLCDSVDTPAKVFSALSDCDSCLTLTVLSRLHLGSNATEHHTSLFLQSVCQSHSDVLPKCEAFTQRYGRQLQGLLVKELGPLDMCEKADLCVSMERKVPVLGDPCTLGPKYSCRNMQTAEECGVVAFCQKNVWY